MHDNFFIKVIESSEDLFEYIENVLLGNMCAFIFIHVVQQTSIAEFHYNHRSIVLLDQILNLHNVWVIELSQIVNFSEYFLSFGTINFGFKVIAFEFFHGIESIIDFTFNLNDDALATLNVDNWDGFLIIV